ncbi:hypothetical protein TRFO_26889 [Tritrichomonas foetus]|uniref:Intimal thickness related receptor IRP domain-containing protein n=1 Tax=Tritrichomonas foetus TaxID=1144522 RepID=A0A1J4K6R5_9EUKA|nr:hypothetical protein TRFO_26889 [Tritrichomonas foetus]|eukprot:OHT05406.1 hypothetical protein TRFO_26889 [Tritrichomonas foetus]
MFFSILITLCYRITGKASFYTDIVSLGNFGFYKNGTFSFTLANNISNFKAGRVKLFIMTAKQYKSFLRDYMNFEIDIETCSYNERYEERMFNLSIGQVHQFSDFIEEKGVYYSIIMNCDYNSAKFNDYYFVDAVYTNPNDQHLDYRDIPKLIMYPIFLGLVSLLLVLFVIFLIIRKRHFLKIYIFILLCCVFYILFLVFSYISIKFDSTHDERSKWHICLTIFECLYCIGLFSLLMVSTRGWCILNVELNWKETLLNIFSVCVFFSMIYLQNNVTLNYWELGFFAIEIVAMIWMARALFLNSHYAQKHINAHMYVIKQAGIDPTTTPIYEKTKMYTYFLYVIISVVSTIIIMNICLTWVEADNWLISMTNIIIQFVTLLSTMIIFRPRGIVIDQYMMSDLSDEGERDEVRLDDLDGFNPNDKGGAVWQEGMKLPLQPILVGEEVSRKPMKKSEVAYTSIEEPILQNGDV